MANPIAVPGTNVPSGAAVSPGGAQGVQGAIGPTGPAGPTGATGTSNSKLVIGDTVTDANIVNGIPVPRYAAHPDRIWTYGAKDDHFDGSTLNAKWTQTVMTAGQIAVSGSHVHLVTATPTVAQYTTVIDQAIPTGVNLAISMKLRWSAYVGQVTGAYAQIAMDLYAKPGYAAGIEMVQIQLYNTTLSPVNNNSRSTIYIGANATTVFADVQRAGEIAPYWQIQYTQSNKTSSFSFSFDGITWVPFLSGITGAQSGFSTTTPTNFQISSLANNSGLSVLSLDWFRVQ